MDEFNEFNMQSLDDDNVELPQDDDEQEEVRDELAEMVMEKFRQAKAYRATCEIMGRTIDDWLMRLYNAYNKIHEQEELEEFKNMRSYFGLVQMKTHTVSAYIRSKYINPSSPPFNIEPTPIVSLPQDKDEQAFEQVKTRLAQAVLGNNIPFDALVENGLLLPEVVRFIEKQAREAKDTMREEQDQIAKEATRRMAILIKDQLVESNFTGTMTEALLDISLYPYMVIAYEPTSVVDQKWINNQLVEQQVIRPTFRRVDPFNAYFAPNATTAQDGEFFIEVLRRSKAQLSSFIGNEELGYFDDVIKDILLDGNDDWLSTHLNLTPKSDDEITVLRCQTLVKGKDLREYGVTEISEDDDFKYFNADLEVCDDRIIRCSLVAHPQGHRTYFSASYKRVAGEPFGLSVGMMVYDRQISVNRTQYSMLLNTRYAAGPMLEIDAQAFDNPAEVTLTPFTRIFSNPTKENNSNGIRQHQIQLTFNALYGQLVNEIRLADDECGLPAFLNGNTGLQGAGRTLGGLALMTDNAVLGLKDCALNIDQHFIKPAITLLYTRNLVNNPDPSIKADAKVIATGLMGIETELNKSQELAQIVPMAGQLTQSGTIPQDLYKDLVRDWLDAKGVDTSRYMPSNGVTNDIQTARSQSPVDQLDGRSLRQM